MSPLPFAVLSNVKSLLPADMALALAATTSVCIAIAGLTIRVGHPWALVLATLGAAGLLVTGAPALVSSPMMTLVALVTLTGGLTWLWNLRAGRQRFRTSLPSRPTQRAVGSALTALPTWLAMSVLGGRHLEFEIVAVLSSLGISSFLILSWVVREGIRTRGGALAIAAALGVQIAVMALLAHTSWGLVSGATILPVTGLIALPRRPFSDIQAMSPWEAFFGHPERFFVGTFLSMCAFGALLLSLPASSATGEGISGVDAAFTAVSAVCVTGLGVLDTPTSFTRFGQVIIVVLIQIGGLGIMTFSTAALRVLGRRMSLRHEAAVASLISERDRGRLFTTARGILALTLGTEAIGASLLTIAFLRHGDSFGQALWRGVFTAVSAFCNAGFALQSDNLVAYQTDPFVLHVVSLLIILGGLSPAAIFALPVLMRRRKVPVSLQVMLGLSTSIVLLALGFVMYLSLEWSNTLGHLSWPDRMHNAWLQCVTLRTAGFNSVDITKATDATVSFMMVWMFIGGTPGSTAGGIKTTTLAVLVLSVVRAVQGRSGVIVFGRRIAEVTRARASVIVTVALFGFLIATMAIQLTQTMSARDGAFEVVSALGTVGLSIGGTANLDAIGKVIIMSCMFIGRVGGVTLLMILSEHGRPPAIERPAEEFDVG